MTTELIVSCIGLFLGLVAVGTCWLLWVDLRSVWECLADVEDEIDGLAPAQEATEASQK